MLKNKYVVIASGVLLLAGLGAGGFLIWHGHQHQVQLGTQLDNLQTAAVDSGASASVPLTQTSNNSSSSGLSVGTDNGVGQLGSNQSGQSTVPSSQNQSAARSNNANNAFDPTTFAQYDKYKDSSSALFGDVQAGNGAELTANHKAAVYYKGWLTNGQLFDQSRPDSSGQLQPFVFTEGAHQVIPGWEEGLAGMKVGGTRLVIVPPGVGYGSQGQGSIPPNAVLIFEVQLLDVQ